MQRITFINSIGRSIVLKDSGPFLLSKLEGLGDVDAEIQRQKAPFQDGSTFIDSVLQERLITLEFAIRGEHLSEVQRKRVEAASIFNPKLGEGIIRYENDYGVKEIKAIPDTVPIFPSGPENRGRSFQRALVNLICPSPFWMDVNAENIKLEDFVGQYHFPFRFPVRFASRGDSRVLTNIGDVPTPIKVTFRGEAINPKITNLTTGEFIKVIVKFLLIIA